MNWLNELTEHYRKQDNLVDIFGLILYTDEHANIKKVVSDEDYWASFHEISGKNWVIFSVRPRKGRYGFPEFEPGQLGMMCMVWKEPRENKQLLNMFGLNDTKELPLLVVYTHDAQNNILSNSIKLDDNSPDTAYNSTKKALQVVTNAVDRIGPEYRKNSEGVSNAVDMAISSHKQWIMIKKGLNFYSWIKGIMP